jgi:hypothetical protein
MSVSIKPPYEVFSDIDGQPLENGYIWLGVAGLDPQANPVSVYWDAALSIAAVQPIRTIAGYPANSGTPASLYVSGDYSIRVQNKNGAAVYGKLFSAGQEELLRGDLALSTGAALVGVDDGADGGILENAQDLVDYTLNSNTPNVRQSPFNAVLNGATVATTQIQSAVSATTETIISGGVAVSGAITVPPAHVSLGIATRVNISANEVSFLNYTADTSRQSVRVLSGGGRVDGNGKTPSIGMTLGSVTDNPSEDAREAILYYGLRDMMYSNLDVGVDSRVSMEHAWNNVVLFQNQVGAKFYADPVNGGENANIRAAVRFQSNVVGGVLRSFSDNPVVNNVFDGATLQGNSVNGFAAIGYSEQGKIAGLTFRGFHAEVNGAGAATSTVDGVIIPRSDFYLSRAEVVLADSDVASFCNPFVQLENSSAVHAQNLTGYGNPAGDVFRQDATSRAYESGFCINVGSKKVETYGFLPAVGSMFVEGSPSVVRIGTYRNDATMANPAIPDTTNSTGTIAQVPLYDESFGAVAAVQFAGSAGSTSTNRVAFYGGATTAGNKCIMAFLVQANADTNFTFNSQFASGHRVDTVALKVGQWRRIVVTGTAPATTGITMYVYPNDGIGAVLNFKAFSWIASDNINDINNVYHYGQCGVPWQESERLDSAPASGSWPIGYVLWKITATAGASPGWVRVSGAWKAMANLAA